MKNESSRTGTIYDGKFQLQATTRQGGVSHSEGPNKKKQHRLNRPRQLEKKRERRKLRQKRGRERPKGALKNGA